jgi:hypothetical protein
MGRRVYLSNVLLHQGHQADGTMASAEVIYECHLPPVAELLTPKVARILRLLVVSDGQSEDHRDLVAEAAGVSHET